MTTTGRRLDLAWALPRTGPAPTGFLVAVSGAFTGAFALPSRAVRGVVGPGAYTLTVRATNACGASEPAPPQTVVVP